jgi:hypothetical protein
MLESHRLQTVKRFNAKSKSCLALVLTLAPMIAAPNAESKSKFTGGAQATPVTQAAGPQVVMGLTRRDFGDVFAGEELEQNFPVRNAGTTPLELSEKSTLGVRASEGHALTAALDDRKGQIQIRRVAATRAAPS